MKCEVLVKVNHDVDWVVYRKFEADSAKQASEIYEIYKKSILSKQTHSACCLHLIPNPKDTMRTYKRLLQKTY